MTRSLLALSTAVAWLGLAGCAANSGSMQTQQTDVEGLPGITAYYEQATAPHHRAVRKPVRDARARAMRLLARETEDLIAETEEWGSDARLVSIAETERPAARDAVAGFRTSLQDLQVAADRSDVRGVRQEYARVMASYRHVNEKIGSAD